MKSLATLLAATLARATLALVSASPTSAAPPDYACLLSLETDPLGGGTCPGHTLSWSMTGGHGRCTNPTSGCKNIDMWAKVTRDSDGVVVSSAAWTGNLSCVNGPPAPLKNIKVYCPGVPNDTLVLTCTAVCNVCTPI